MPLFVLLLSTNNTAFVLVLQHVTTFSGHDLAFFPCLRFSSSGLLTLQWNVNNSKWKSLILLPPKLLLQQVCDPWLQHPVSPIACITMQLSHYFVLFLLSLLNCKLHEGRTLSVLFTAFQKWVDKIHICTTEENRTWLDSFSLGVDCQTSTPCHYIIFSPLSRRRLLQWSLSTSVSMLKHRFRNSQS